MTLLSADSFDRADSTTNLGSTDGAGILDPLAWTQHTGVWGIIGNEAYTSTTAALAYATVDLGTPEIDLSLVMVVRNDPSGNGAGIVFRLSDTSNFWYARQSSTTGKVQLRKVVAGSDQLVGESPTNHDVNGDTIRVVARGSSIEVFREGVSQITTTDSHNSTATKHGLLNVVGVSHRLDDWSSIDPPGVVHPTAATGTGAAFNPSVSIAVPAQVATGTGSAPNPAVRRPIVTGATPSEGPTIGGTHVTITGTDLSPTLAVAFGDRPATSFVDDLSGTTVTAVSPPHIAEIVPVIVTTPDGSSQ